MNKNIKALLGACFLIAAVDAGAAAQPRHTIVGPGASTCNYWTEARLKREEERAARMLDWVTGRLVSYGHYSLYLHGKPFETPPPARIAAMLDTFCAEHPGTMLSLAAAALVESLGGADIKYKWER